MPYLSIATTLVMLVTLGLSAQAWGAGNEHRQSTPGMFDYYSLTLLWSPSYCAEHEGGPGACRGIRHMGFVLQSLAPMFETGLWPEYCTEQTLSSLDRTTYATLYPAMPLMERNWAQHGTCTDLSPASFFQLGKDLISALHIPSAFINPDQPFKATREDITKAFLGANPDISENELAVNCNDRYFTSVHVCYDKTGTSPAPCGARELATAAKSCPASFTVRSVR
jgi:ribonuclease T2